MPRLVCFQNCGRFLKFGNQQNDKLLYWCQRLKFHTTSRLMTSSNPYAVLGLTREASQKDIKNAYYKLVKKYHPDQNKSVEASTKFKEIKDAYEILNDPQKKSAYDSGGSPFGQKAAHSNQNFYTSNNPNANFTNNPNTNSDFSDVFTGNDIFSTLFGQGFGRQNYDFNNVRQNTIYQSEIKVSFLEAARGTSSTVTLTMDESCSRCQGKRADPSPQSVTQCASCKGSGYNTQKRGNLIARIPCSSCGGLGEIIKKYCILCHGSGSIAKTSSVTVQIPAGIETGQVIRQTVNNNIIDFVVTVMKSNDMWREFNDIHSHLNVDFVQAISGGVVAGRTIHGAENVKISPGTSSHNTVIIPGKGIFGMNGRHGAHVFHIKINIPKSLTASQKKSLKTLIYEK